MFAVHKNKKFSTKDQDNDVSSSHCSVAYKGAWWYGACFRSNLNGPYKEGGHTSYGYGVIWYDWKMSFYYALKTTEMKIRPL